MDQPCPSKLIRTGDALLVLPTRWISLPRPLRSLLRHTNNTRTCCWSLLQALSPSLPLSSFLRIQLTNTQGRRANGAQHKAQPATQADAQAGDGCTASPPHKQEKTNTSLWSAWGQIGRVRQGMAGRALHLSLLLLPTASGAGAARQAHSPDEPLRR